jgi:hypothetical protein
MTVFLRRPARPPGNAPSPQDVAAALGVDMNRFVPRASRGMFAGTPHSREEIQTELLACLNPAFNGILGDPGIERRINRAMATAKATPNWGLGNDIPGNGSEQGLFAGKLRHYGAITGPAFGSRQEREVDFDTADEPILPVDDLTAIHVHQSPRGAAGLSQLDLDLAEPPPVGLGINVVAVDKNGARYCKVRR